MFDFLRAGEGGTFVVLLVVALVIGGLGHAAARAIRHWSGKSQGRWNDWNRPPAVLVIAPMAGALLGFHYGGWSAALIAAFLLGASSYLIFVH